MNTAMFAGGLFLFAFMVFQCIMNVVLCKRIDKLEQRK